MAYRIATNASGSGTQYDLGTTDSLVVPTNVAMFLDSDVFPAINATGSLQGVSVYGFVGAGDRGIYMNSSDSTSPSNHISNYNIYIGSQGVVDAAYEGIYTSGGSTKITNFGKINSQLTNAIVVSSDISINNAKIVNYGDVSGI